MKKNNGKLKKKLLIAAASMMFPVLLMALLVGGLVSGTSQVVPQDEKEAKKYQVCSQLGVNWDWVMLIDMYTADISKTQMEEQNLLYTSLNCLKVTIDVYSETRNKDEETSLDYDHTEYAFGADAILEYFGLPADCKDAYQVIGAIQRKNGNRYRITTQPYESLEIVLDTYYSFDEETRKEMLALDEAHYLAELYKDCLGEYGEAGGILGDFMMGDLEYPPNGMEIPRYLQYQEPWRSIPFGGGTIATSGCSVTSLAMVFSYLLDRSVLPSDIVKWTGNRFYNPPAGQSWGIYTATADHWGLTCTNLGRSISGAMQELSEGHPVIASVSAGTFTKNRHLIVLRGLTETGEILVNDPNDNSSKNILNRSFTPELILRESNNFWSFRN